MQVPILSGIFTDEAGDFRTSLPRNMVPVPKDQGISKGYLRPAEGIAQVGTGPGVDRGGINWNGACYRVMGSNLVRVSADGAVTTLGTVGGTGQVSLDYSFDRLAIAAGGSLYYWNGSSLQQVTDPDLGLVLDVLWIDGYFMTTDGVDLVVTDLTDPTSVSPLHYGSSEADPDRVMRLLKLREEARAVNRYTIEAFDNVGGNVFPYQANEGALIARGALGTHCAVVFAEQIAFLGSGRDEPPAIYIGDNGSSRKISSREIDTLLQGYTEAQLSMAVVEARVDKSHQLLLVHLPDRTLVYDAAASAVAQELAWHTLDSGLMTPSVYRARNFVWCYNRWLCGDPTSGALGEVDITVSTHYGQTIGWEFGTSIIYNNGFGAILHQVELVTLPGRVALGADPVVWTSHSLDGETWSMERPCSAGTQGDRTRRLTWLRQGRMPHWRIQRFRGTSDAHLSVARLEIQVEALSV